MVYLMKQEARNGSYYKIGYSKNINKRLVQYVTTNANIKCIEYIKTYRKTKHTLETAIHNELKELGYSFVNNYNTNTEWVFIPFEYEYDFEHKGLSQFKACKGRKVYKVEA